MLPDVATSTRTSADREAWLAVVETADGERETELVTIERDAGGVPTIDLTDGTRITCVEFVGAQRI
jgi:hypothetical protein